MKRLLELDLNDGKACNELLREVINEVNDVRYKIRDFMTDLHDKESNLEIMKNDVRQKIVNAVDEKGKALYSNESKRKVALESILDKNEEYKKLSDEIVSCKNKLNTIKLKQQELEGIINFFKYKV